ncbi:hypothetical protein AVEN_199211-1 [Araneus ventricosus]|uniref:Uncharacterized protein n=1 Tax=Araneus ventricosus TaxID=182803 RepID=A0A4Y2R8X5_ARAVE|nr:hypothetical protein AVEN_199211-1 [Araneus ventricosus]
MNTDEEPTSKRRRMTKERKARWLARQSQESLDRIRAVDAADYRRRIEADTPSQTVIIRGVRSDVEDHIWVSSPSPHFGAIPAEGHLIPKSLTCISQAYLTVLWWNRVSNLEPFDSKAGTLPLRPFNAMQ